MALNNSSCFAVRYCINGFSTAAVTAGLVLSTWVAPFKCDLTHLVANAGTAGTGAGNTVLDILVNGVSIFVTTANRPTLAAASTGAFALSKPDGYLALRAGDVVQLKVLSIPATTGHANVACTAAVSMR